MKKVKFSFYNELIPVEESNNYLLFNIINSGLEILDRTIGELLNKLKEEKEFNLEAYPEHTEVLDYLYEHNYLVNSELDEKAKYQADYELNQKNKFRNSSQIGLTIGTTIICNMGCPYCFEVDKPNKTLNDKTVIKAITTYIESMIQKAPVKRWESFSVIWYGGEPLINKNAIEVLSQKLIKLAADYDIPYNASIITNGILLDRDTWQLLKKNKVGNVQITIDGAKEVHNKYRPLKNKNALNYEKILENISMMPEELSTTIRVNTDKLVASTLPRMLDDLKKYGIWPQRYKNVSIQLAWLRSYEGADVSNISGLTSDEYFDVEHSFSELQVQRFQEWASKNQINTPKLKWKLPKKQSDCATYVSPYFFTFDPEGNIHKCWETVHDSEQSSGTTVLKNWEPKDFDKYLSYSRTRVHPICYNCKFNPVCEGLSCAFDTLKGLEEEHFPCTAWKTKLPEYFKKMYLLKQESPDSVALLSPRRNKVQAHANR